MNVCARRLGVDPHGDDELVRLERVLLHADEELGERQRRSPRTLAISHLGVLDEERRQRVAGRRRRAEVAADRAAVADLRRADRARRLGQRRQRAGERPLHRLGVGEPGAEDERAVLARPPAQLRDLVEVDQRRRARAVEVELDEHVGAALDEARLRELRLEAAAPRRGTAA